MPPQPDCDPWGLGDGLPPACAGALLHERASRIQQWGGGSDAGSGPRGWARDPRGAQDASFSHPSVWPDRGWPQEVSWPGERVPRAPEGPRCWSPQGEGVPPWQVDLYAGQRSQGPRTRLPAEDGHSQRGPECAHGKPRQADLSAAHGSTQGRSCQGNPESLTTPPSTPAPPLHQHPLQSQHPPPIPAPLCLHHLRLQHRAGHLLLLFITYSVPALSGP